VGERSAKGERKAGIFESANKRGSMHTTAPSVIERFVVEIEVDPKDPKLPAIEQLEDRLGESVQFMDGVVKARARFDGQREA
jgi:hypothetical protein